MINLKIKEMIENGFATKRISNLLNIPESEVKNQIDINQWDLLKEEFSNDKIPQIIDLYEQGVSAKLLGKKYSIDKRRVQKWANEKGLLRDKSSSHRFTNFNQNIFDVIDSADKAYWLGFFYADAYNCDITNTFSVTLKDEDYNHLVKLSNFVDLPSNKVKRYLSELGDKKYPTCCIRLYSKHLCEKMTNLGVPRAKSFIITYPQWLDPKLNVAFIRGMFDGDGSLAHRSNNEWKWSLVTTKECGEVIQRIILKELDLIINLNCISKTGNNTYELESNGNERVLKLATWLYKDSSINTRLDRKYERMLELQQQQDGRRFERKEYKVSESVKSKIIDKVDAGEKMVDVAKQHQVHPRTVSKIVSENKYNPITNITNNKRSDYDRIVEINGKLLTASYVKTLSREERFELIEPLFQHFRALDWQYPNNLSEVKKSWKELVEYKPDLSVNALFNNDSLATDICKYYCHKFYDATEYKQPTMKQIFYNDDKLRKLIQNRLGLDWKDPNNTETFNISFRMLIQGMRSARMVPSVSIFKPGIAKYLYMKYSNEGEVVFDYSAGWGGRMLGAASCGRKYIGVDPWTTDELEVMKDELGLQNVTLINSGSEHVKLEENSVDFAFSSPPYYCQELYVLDDRQAYAKGEEHFYNVYWKGTLENVKYMLKSGKYFGLNVKNYPKMVEMAEQVFGPVVEEVYLRTVRSHLTKTAGVTKNESIYLFKCNK